MTIKEYADSGVKCCAITASKPVPPAPYTTPNVPATTSFANIPDIRAIVACQVPKPAGLNICAIIELILPITLSSLAYSTPGNTREKPYDYDSR